MASRPPQVDAYQPGKAWNEQPFSYRTQWENKAEEEMAAQRKSNTMGNIMMGQFGKVGQMGQITAEDVQQRAEEMAKASGYAPSFGDWEDEKSLTAGLS